VTRPGGWVELVEPAMVPNRAGPANERLVGLMHEVAGGLGLDSGRVVFESLDGWLRGEGMADVTRRELAMPVGNWEGPVGALMAIDIRAFYTRICEALQARSRLTGDEVRGLVGQAQEEWEERRMSWPFAIVFGRRR
jgi:hypothetical protein